MQPFTLVRDGTSAQACPGCGRSFDAENVSRKSAISRGSCRRFPPSWRRGADRILRTRQAGKRHLRSEPRRQRRPDPADSAEALHRAERAEGIPVRDDSLRQRGPDAVQGLNESRRGGVHVHGRAGCAARPLGLSLRPAAFTSGPGGIHSAELIAQRGCGGGIIGSVAVRARDSDARAEGDDGGEEK